LEDVLCMGMVRKLLNILNTCEESVQPDEITFLCLLSACSHGVWWMKAYIVMLQ
jgi:hypothetical protein